MVRVADNGTGGAAPARARACAGLTIASRRAVGRCRSRASGRRYRPDRGAAVRVVIAEDQVLLREGLARLFATPATRWPPRSAMPTASRRGRGARPDLVVIDVRMPPTFTDEGTRAAAEIKRAHPDVGVLVLSQHIETMHAVALVALGGFGYLLKDRVLDVGEFLEAAERVARGGSALLLSGQLGPRRAGPLSRSPSGSARCSAGGSGSRTRDRTAPLPSQRTVEAHVRHVLIKLDLPEGEHGHRRVLAVLAHVTLRRRTRGAGRARGRRSRW